MEQVKQQEPLQKFTVMRMIESSMNVVHIHLTRLETYGAFGGVLFGKTFLEQIRDVDGNMERVAGYFFNGGDADRLPMDELRTTREYIHRLIPMVGNMDAAYTAALYRIKTNMDTALKYADTKVKEEEKSQERKTQPLSAIIITDNLGEDEHGHKRTAQDLINRLRELINDCERPTDVAAILVAAEEQGYLKKFPSEKQYKEIGAKNVGSYSTMSNQKGTINVKDLAKKYTILR